MRTLLPLCLLILTCCLLVSCGDDDDSFGILEGEPDDGDSYTGEEMPPGSGDKERLFDFLSQFGFDEYLDVQYESSKPGMFGYTDYFYSKTDCRCFNGSQAHVSVLPGSENKVLLFLEGGGAKWPGGGVAINQTMPFPTSFRRRTADNPIKDWHFIYVPYCDASTHSGDSQILYDGKVKYHWGLRNTAAAVSLAKQLFPEPEKVLLAGASAGSFGTFYAWALVKYVYLDIDTYILNDSGPGFFDPAKPEVFEVVSEAWNLGIPDECEKCNGPIFTYIYETYMQFDPQLRIGMFSSYRDWVVSWLFLQMDPVSYENTLLNVTGQIHDAYPDRFKRFFIKGNTHTSNELHLTGGPKYTIDDTTMFEWIGHLVNDDPEWRDLLE